MEIKTILFFLAIISPTFSRIFGSWEDTDDTIPELYRLFNGEDAENEKMADEKYTVCDTRECQIIGADFERSMNKSVNPCDDFYEYVCGNWKTHNPIPPHAILSGRFQKFQEIALSRIKGILEIEPETSDILPVRQAKKWYRSCMNTEALERRGLKPLESILVQTGGWPMTMDFEEWNEDDHTWQSIEEHYLHITGEYIFYKVSPRPGRDKDIALDAGNLPLEQELDFLSRNYSGNDYNGYVKFIESIIEIFVDEHRSDVSTEMIQRDIHYMVEFEKKLFLLGEEHFKSDNTTIDDFIKMYDANITKIENEENKIERINFRRMIRRVFEWVHYDIKDSTPLYAIDSAEYWMKLTKILNETPKRTIVNYIHWHFVSSVMKYTTENLRELIFKHKSDVLGVTAREPRWLECVKEMKMTGAASYAFTQKYFHDHTENDVREMIYHIRDEIKSQIRETTWLDESSKQLAVDKLNAMKVFLGYPDWYKNETFVLNSYNGLTIGSDHFGNVLSYQRYQIKRSLRRMPEDSSMTSQFINAMYRFKDNSIELPAADFQPPLFTAKLPRNINYGMAGVVIGHEIGHGFDVKGMKYGKDGNETNVSKHMMDMYYKRAKCYLNQFNDYWGVTDSDYDESSPAYGQRSAGRRTWGENIADSTGLDSVFEAYRKMMKNSQKADNKLPGFEEYTDNQMFFLSFGLMWCQAGRPEYTREQEKFDDHSTARLRVIGPISNTNDFARAFNCPKGSPMNPENKCGIWKSSEKHSGIDENSELPLYYQRRNHIWQLNW